ncbi:Major facilitator superfamily domain general substrate transporter [Penicillium concentricum]|uniref:Major facilitator superfamily domain general substrate transporter n=1 Tax=Penicillium concentricum TaxID=293559 RepID=A0A9W9SQ76_9EURO|nr:Major facilitator superfamily domain general substrate transporter [Penicillium concentricum]KAJ5382627.1 Major facilitator superfamily domain general substrate transporter [Penicillium concentricum]
MRAVVLEFLIVSLFRGIVSTMDTMTPDATLEQGTDQTMAKRVLWKIDRRLIPLLFTTYMFNFMDKTILSSASVFGLRDDTGLVGQQYSWVSSIFYFGYLGWVYPTTLLIARVPAAKYLTANTFFWGAVVALTAACTNYGGLITVRFLLGVAEATITPAFMFITSTWYTRDEIPTRTGLWFAGNSVGGILSSLLAYGLGHVKDHVGPWRWMFIVLGCATFLWSFAIWILLPDSISKASFLTEEERQFASNRAVVAGTGSTEKTAWRWDQFLECLMDPKTWLIFGLELCTQIPNGGTQNFANLVIVSFGFTSLQSTLITIPYSIITIAAITGSGWLAGRFRHMNCLLVVAVVLPCVVGSAIIYSREHIVLGVQLFGYFLLSTGPAAMPLALSLVQSNYRGVTKKMTVTAMLFLAYCAGNISGPQFFLSHEAPHYNTAFRTIMICYALAVVLALALRFYLQWFNARRVRLEGFVGSSGNAGAVGGKALDTDDSKNVADMVNQVQLVSDDYEDVTDWKTPGFRYRY